MNSIDVERCLDSRFFRRWLQTWTFLLCFLQLPCIGAGRRSGRAFLVRQQSADFFDVAVRDPWYVLHSPQVIRTKISTKASPPTFSSRVFCSCFLAISFATFARVPCSVFHIYGRCASFGLPPYFNLAPGAMGFGSSSEVSRCLFPSNEIPRPWQLRVSVVSNWETWTLCFSKVCASAVTPSDPFVFWFSSVNSRWP